MKVFDNKKADDAAKKVITLSQTEPTILISCQDQINNIKISIKEGWYKTKGISVHNVIQHFVQQLPCKSENRKERTVIS